MSMRRTEVDRLQELVRLHRMSTGPREVARLLGVSPNTERVYRRALEAEGLLAGAADELPALEVLKAAVARQVPARTAPQATSSIEEWADQVRALHEQKLGPRAIYDRLCLERDDFRGTYWAVKRLCRRLGRARGVRPEDVAIPVETRAGEVAQVDFGYVGRLFDPETRTLRRAWVFVMVLGYSRYISARIVFDQRLETWLRLHVECFAELGGVPETVVPDNLKAAVIRAAFGPTQGTELNRSYRELARHYGFKIDPTPPYAPRKKGKVESAVRYLKGNFFRGRDETDAEVLRPELARWLRDVAGERVHGATGRRPRHVLEQEERGALTPLPAKSFTPVLWRRATVHRDSHIAVEKRLYSVPWRLVGGTVWVRVTPASIEVYAEDQRVATHARRGSGGRSTVDAHLPEHRAALRHRSRAYWEERAALMGSDVVDYVRDVFDSDDVLSQLRAVQAIVAHLETFPPERAQAACRRARFYANHTYQGLKNILRRGLDLEPLPVAVAAAPDAARPRFARTIQDLLPLPTETPHECN
jgi:transposase